MVMRSAEGIICEDCRKEEAVVFCSGCEKAICRECRIFDIWCYGCGSGDVKAFCRSCNNDPEVNIWKGPESGSRSGSGSV
ncbi:MAG: B-box zinc finger protein [Syntrophales bacterium]|jgi:hypothetical protein|nr:B-box zinc finger protein [Syntrophales bacterium]MCK9528118.1 B-box zinc finger protein [Syntrophales bacterium]MDX9921087.1 B-box zinc finger protein [Syntrophales bacterium]